ncbi:hypothetical protein GCM10009608_02860 [Pseudonocardia alaniniphila]
MAPGDVPSVHNPVTYSATPPSYRLPTPALDVHGAEIHERRLGNCAICPHDHRFGVENRVVPCCGARSDDHGFPTTPPATAGSASPAGDRSRPTSDGSGAAGSA